MSSVNYKRKFPLAPVTYCGRSSSVVSNSKYSRPSSPDRQVFRPAFRKAEDYSRVETLFEKTRISSMRYRYKTHANGDPSYKVCLKKFKDVTNLRNTDTKEVMLIKFYPPTSKPKDTFLPVGLEVSVNGREVDVPPINNNTEGRLNCPVEVDPKILNLENYIRISCVELEKRGFSIAVLIAERKKQKENERQKPKVATTKKEGKYNVKSKEDVIEEIKRKLGKNSAREDDDVVATSTIVLKLTCPLGMCRMVTPARFQNCNHLNCFEIETFSKMKKKDKCPVCLKAVSMKRVFVDLYMKEICQMSNNDAVQLNQDGSWREVENRNENIDEIESDEEEEILQANTSNHTTIDLCSSTDDSSSDEDDGSPCSCAECQGNCDVVVID